MAKLYDLKFPDHCMKPARVHRPVPHGEPRFEPQGIADSRDPGRQCPLVFMVPAEEMKDLDGNGPGWPVRDSLRSLTQALLAQGIAVARFVSEEVYQEPEKVRSIYEEAVRDPRVSRNQIALVGFCEGADLIARSFYSFYSVRPPHAAVLLSPRAPVLHLNNLTCPYLILHGAKDPLFRYESYDRFNHAVHHHQMRYGDLTTQFLYQDLGRELGDLYISPEVVTQAVDWVKSALKHEFHHQEKAGEAAA